MVPQEDENAERISALVPTTGLAVVGLILDVDTLHCSVRRQRQTSLLRQVQSYQSVVIFATPLAWRNASGTPPQMLNISHSCPDLVVGDSLLDA